MPTKIPGEWKKTVRDILVAVDYDNIILRERARLDWEATFPLLFPCDLYLAIGNELEDPDLEGKKEEMREPGETYAFIFHQEEKKLYTKICLCPDGQVIIVYSAHTPLKGDTL